LMFGILQEPTESLSDALDGHIGRVLSAQWLLRSNIRKRSPCCKKATSNFNPEHWPRLRALAREHPGLVHLAPSLVGPPASGLVSTGSRRSPSAGIFPGDTVLRAPSPGGRRLPRELRCQVDSPAKAGCRTRLPRHLFSSCSGPTKPCMPRTATRRNFIPTSALVTGPDIIFLWVARLLRRGFTSSRTARRPRRGNAQGQPRFKDVYFTGLIREQAGPQALQVARQTHPIPLDLIAKTERTDSASALSASRRRAPTSVSTKEIEEAVNFCTSSGTSAVFAPSKAPSIFNAEPWSTNAPSSR